MPKTFRMFMLLLSFMAPASIVACDDGSDPCTIHASEDNLNDDERFNQCNNSGVSLHADDEDVVYSGMSQRWLNEKVVESTQVDSTPATAEGQYQLASKLVLEEGASDDTTRAHERIKTLERAIELYLLAGKEIPQEVAPDLRSAVEKLRNLDTLNTRSVRAFLRAWDDGVSKALLRPTLLLYKRLLTSNAEAAGGFEVSLRHRNSDRTTFNPCSFDADNIGLISEIASKLETDDHVIWQIAWADLLTSGYGCEMSTVSEESLREGYSMYVALGMESDANRTAKDGAERQLSDFTSGVISNVSGRVVVPPGDTTYLLIAKDWLSKMLESEKKPLLRERAKHAEHFREHYPAMVLYQILGDSVNTRRMRMLKANAKPLNTQEGL